jgi:histidine triad (HIT) family protein
MKRDASARWHFCCVGSLTPAESECARSPRLTCKVKRTVCRTHLMRMSQLDRTVIIVNMSVESDCPFCRIVNGSEPAHIVYKDEDSIAFLDRRPVAEGHILVVPRIHARTLLDMIPPSAGALMIAATHVARIVDRTLQPEGFTVFQTNEVAGGQSVFHVHLHLVPRWEGDNLVAPWMAKLAEESALARVWLKIIARTGE